MTFDNSILDPLSSLRAYTLTDQPNCKNCGGSYFQHRTWDKIEGGYFPCSCCGCPEDETQKCTEFEEGESIRSKHRNYFLEMTDFKLGQVGGEED